MNINIYNILIGFVAFQGFIFGGLLCWKSKFKGFQKYLGLTVLFLSFYLLWVLKYDFGWQKLHPNLQFLPILFLWGIGPSFYAYLKTLLGFNITKKEIRVLFLPLIIEWLYFNSCTIILWSNNWSFSNFNSFEKAWFYNQFPLEHSVGLVIIAIYLVKSYKLLKESNVLFATNKVRQILFLFFMLWVVWVPYTIIDIVNYDFNFPPSEFYAFYILFSVFTYGLALLGIKIDEKTIKEVILLENISEKPITAEMEVLSKKIIEIMKKEKLFLDSELTLSSFSKKVQIHPNKVSAIINKVIGSSFRDFVNYYRVVEFKERAKLYDFKTKTILSLAFDSGFNSKASFNRAFQKFSKTSPIHYIENRLKN